MLHVSRRFFFFFFNDTATTEIYTLSLHDALPISRREVRRHFEPHYRCGVQSGLRPGRDRPRLREPHGVRAVLDRKSTRLNSSHGYISYAVFCLKKKKKYRERYDACCTPDNRRHEA